MYLIFFLITNNYLNITIFFNITIAINNTTIIVQLSYIILFKSYVIITDKTPTEGIPPQT